VCWRAGSQREYTDGCALLAARADHHAGGLLIINGAPGTAAPDSQPGMTRVTLPEARERVLGAATRAPWVLAPMREITAPQTPAGDLIALELELADLAALTRTAVVCAYHGESWKPQLLDAVSAVHSRVVGMTPGMPGFRLRATGGSYALEGSIGFESVPAFTTALHGALIRTPQLRIGCRRLEMIEAFAMRAMVETVLTRPGSTLLLEGAGEAVHRAWALSGYGEADLPVQVRP